MALDKQDRDLIVQLVASNLTVAGYLRDALVEKGIEPDPKTQEEILERYREFVKILLGK